MRQKIPSSGLEKIVKGLTLRTWFGENKKQLVMRKYCLFLLLVAAGSMALGGCSKENDKEKERESVENAIAAMVGHYGAYAVSKNPVVSSSNSVMRKAFQDYADELSNLFSGPTSIDVRRDGKSGVTVDCMECIFKSIDIKPVLGDVCMNITSYSMTQESEKFLTTVEVKPVGSELSVDLQGRKYSVSYSKEKEKLYLTAKLKFTMALKEDPAMVGTVTMDMTIIGTKE